jgi:hypothetical protein
VVARQTITVRGEDGEPVELVAGQSFVRAPHYLTRTYPDLFAPDNQASKLRPTCSRPRAWAL